MSLFLEFCSEPVDSVLQFSSLCNYSLSACQSLSIQKRGFPVMCNFICFFLCCNILRRRMLTLWSSTLNFPIKCNTKVSDLKKSIRKPIAEGLKLSIPCTKLQSTTTKCVEFLFAISNVGEAKSTVSASVDNSYVIFFYGRSKLLLFNLIVRLCNSIVYVLFFLYKCSMLSPQCSLYSSDEY